jgi:hypothetical protein
MFFTSVVNTSPRFIAQSAIAQGSHKGFKEKKTPG